MSDHTPTPWNLCGEGKCSCLTISCADFPIAKVQSGKWGDDYPAMRQVGASLENKYEAYMEQITYGDINPDVARANAQFIIKAVNNHDALVKALVQARDAIRAVHHEIDNPAMPACLAAAWESADLTLADVGGTKQP